MNRDQERMWDAIEQLIPTLHTTTHSETRPKTPEYRKAIQMLIDYIDDDTLPGNKKRDTIASLYQLQALVLYAVVHIKKADSPYASDRKVTAHVVELIGELIKQWEPLDMHHNPEVHKHIGSLFDLLGEWNNIVLTPEQKQFLDSFEQSIRILRKHSQATKVLVTAIDTAYISLKEILDDEHLLAHSRTRLLMKAVPSDIEEGLQESLPEESFKKLQKYINGSLIN